MSEGRKRTPLPIRERELTACGSGAVITYRLSPAELDHYNRTGKLMREEETMIKIDKQRYLQLRLEGVGRTEIMRTYFKGTKSFYDQLKEWGIKEKDAEDRELDLLQPQTAPSDQKTVVAEAESPQPEPKQESSNDDLVSKIEQLIREYSAAEHTTAKIKQWAIDRGLDSADPAKQMLKLGEEYGELCRSLAVKNIPQVIDAIGDMYVVLVVLSLQLGLDIDDCINQAYTEIKDRKGRMINGVFVKNADIV